MRHTKRAGIISAGLLTLVVSGVFCGCQSVHNGQTTTGADASTIPFKLSPERERQACALAYYSEAVRDQLNGDYASSLSNFVQAVTLDPDADEIYMRIALEQLRRGQSADARATLKLLCHRKPTSYRPYIWQGLVEWSTSHTDEAMASFKRAAELAPNRPEPYWELATAYIHLGKNEEAIRCLEKAIPIVEKHDDLCLLLGELYIQMAEASTNNVSPESAERRKSAIAAMEAALGEKPSNVALLFQLADLYMLDKQTAKAIECYQRAEKLQPNNLQVKGKLALSLAATGDKQGAVNTLEQVAKAEPLNSRVYFYLGDLYEKMGEKDKAIANYRIACRSDPPDPAPFLCLAILLVDDHPDQAILALLEGLEALPGEPRLSETLAYIYLHQHRFEDALFYFQMTDRNQIENDIRITRPTFNFNYAIALQYAGQYERAANLLSQTITINPAYLDAYIQYIVQEDNRTATDQGIKILEILLEKEPGSPVLVTYIGLLHHLNKEYDKGIATFETIEDSIISTNYKPDVVCEYYFWYGACLEQGGQINKAILAFEKCLQVNPDHVEALNYLAYLWAEKGEHLEKALEYANSALAKKPDNPAYLDTLGWIYYKMQRYQEAFDKIKKASDMLPTEPTIHEHLGDTLLKLGKKKEAIEEWLLSYNIDPSNSNVVTKLKAYYALPAQPPTPAVTN